MMQQIIDNASSDETNKHSVWRGKAEKPPRRSCHGGFSL